MVAIKGIGMPKNCAECIVRHECKQADEWDEFDWYYDGRLDDCPLVEIEERKVGKWIKTGGSFRCSECFAMPEFSDIRELKYCPHCGVDMRGNNVD